MQKTSIVFSYENLELQFIVIVLSRIPKNTFLQPKLTLSESSLLMMDF